MLPLAESSGVPVGTYMPQEGIGTFRRSPTEKDSGACDMRACSLTGCRHKCTLESCLAGLGVPASFVQWVSLPWQHAVDDGVSRAVDDDVIRSSGLQQLLSSLQAGP